MAGDRQIRDIRYYESDYPRAEAAPTAGGPAHIFLTSACIAWGVRIARKLREYGFVAGTFDHVYLRFTPRLPDHEIAPPPHVTEPWMREFAYGLSTALATTMEPLARERLVMDATFRTLRLLAAGHTDRVDTLARVERELAEHGADLEVLVLTKATKRYRLTVSYQVRAHPESCIGWIEYENLRTGLRGKRIFAQLQSWDDVYPLTGSVSVTKDAIVIKPRASFKASLYTQHYQTPIVLALSELAAPSGGAPRV